MIDGIKLISLVSPFLFFTITLNSSPIMYETNTMNGIVVKSNFITLLYLTSTGSFFVITCVLYFFFLIFAIYRRKISFLRQKETFSAFMRQAKSPFCTKSKQMSNTTKSN